MRFTIEHCETFRRLSHDANPLHVNADYARRSQFGQTVVHGIAVTLWAIAQWSRGRRIRLESIVVQFNKPVFLEQDYQFRYQETGNRVVLRIFKEHLPRMKVQFEWKEWDGSSIDESDGEQFRPLASPRSAPSEIRDATAYVDRARCYRLCSEAVKAFEALFGPGPAHIPFSQLQVLAWSSYFVGMEVPGRQALFTDLAIVFSGAADSNGPLNLETLEIALDERFGRFSVTASAPAAARIELAAFQRPDPVRYEIEDIRRHLEGSRRFDGRTALITGAARGFGSVVAIALALLGANQILVVRRITGEVLELQRTLASIGATCELIEADVSDEADCVRCAESIAGATTSPDMLVLNAWPTPPVLAIRESTAQDVLDYVSQGLATAIRPLLRLLPALAADLTIVNISTIFVSRPEPNFTAYVASKSAFEAFLASLALESKSLRILNARLPRMLTDTTNVVQRASEPASAARMAGRLLQEVAQGVSPGFHTIEIDALSRIEMQDCKT